jgi:hypothetical protein
MALGHSDRGDWLDRFASGLPRWHRTHDVLRTQRSADGRSAGAEIAEAIEFVSEFIERRVRHPGNDCTRQEDVLRCQRHKPATSVDRLLATLGPVLRRRRFLHRRRTTRNVQAG